MASLKEDLNTIQFLKQHREPYEDTIEQIKELMMPWRFELNTETDPGEPRISGSFDSLAAVEADKMVNFVVGNVFPPTGDWMRLAARGQEDTPANRQIFDEATDELMQILAESNFYTQAAYALRDDVVTGNGYLYLEPRTPVFNPSDGSTFSGIDYEAVPFNRLWRLLDRAGRPLVVCREFEMMAFEAERFFAKDNFKYKGDPLDELTFYHLARVAKKPKEDHMVDTRWIWHEQDKSIRTGKLSFMPYAVSRWDVVDGEQYGVGRGHIARPTAAGRNELKRQILMSAGRDINPTLLVEHDSIMNVDRASHGIIILKPSVANRPEYLNTNTNYAAAQQVAQEDAEQIRAAFLTDLLGEPDSVERSAEGSRQRQARIVQQVASPAQNISTNFLAPVIEATVGLARAGGKLAMLDGLEENIEVTFVSPFFTLQKQQAVQKVADFLNFKVQMAQLAERPDILDDVNFDKASAYISKNSDIPQEILNDEESTNQRRRGRVNLEAADRAVAAASQLGQIPQVQAQVPGDLAGITETGVA